MSLMQQIQSGRQVRPRRLMCYGVHGVGKSSFAARAARPVFLPTEEGLAEIDCDSFPLMRSLEQVHQAIAALIGEEHGYRTVVIDSVDWLERLIFDAIEREFGVDYYEKADGGFGKCYTYAAQRWRKVLEQLDELRNRRGMWVVLLAHAKHEKFHTPEDAAYERYAPRLHKLASALIQEWCDEVFFATYDSASKPANNKTVTPQTAQRVMKTCEGPTYVAKNRLGMPPEVELDWRAYAWFAEQIRKPQSNETGESSNG